MTELAVQSQTVTPQLPPQPVSEPPIREGGDSSLTKPTGAQVLASQNGQPDPAPEPEQPTEQPKPQEDPFSKRFAALAQRERRLLERENQFKERLQRSDLVHKAIEEKNPMAILQAAGFTYQDVTNWVLNDGQRPEPTVNDEVATLKKTIAELQQRLKEEDSQRERAKIEESVTRTKNDIRAFIESNGDRFEVTRALGAWDTVYEVIEQTFYQTLDPLTGVGEILSFEEAAEKVEAYFRDQALKLRETKLFAPKAPEPEQEAQPKPSSGGSFTTLTNSTPPASPGPSEGRYLSDEESKARMAARLRAELAKRGEMI